MAISVENDAVSMANYSSSSTHHLNRKRQRRGESYKRSTQEKQGRTETEGMNRGRTTNEEKKGAEETVGD